MVFVATSHGPRASSRTLAYIKASIRVRSPMLVNVKQSRPLFRQKNTDFFNKPIYAFTRSLIFRLCLYSIYSHIIIRLESPPNLDPVFAEGDWRRALLDIYYGFGKYSFPHSGPYFFSISSKDKPLIFGSVTGVLFCTTRDCKAANILFSLMFFLSQKRLVLIFIG